MASSVHDVLLAEFFNLRQYWASGSKGTVFPKNVRNWWHLFQGCTYCQFHEMAIILRTFLHNSNVASAVRYVWCICDFLLISTVIIGFYLTLHHCFCLNWLQDHKNIKVGLLLVCWKGSAIAIYDCLYQKLLRQL